MRTRLRVWAEGGSFGFVRCVAEHSQAYSFGADVWSLGLIVLEAATGAYPYDATTYIEMVEAVAEQPEPALPRHSSASPELAQFLGHCLRKRASERLPPDILIGAPWFARHRIASTSGSRAQPAGVAAAQEVLRRWMVSERIGARIEARLKERLRIA